MSQDFQFDQLREQLIHAAQGKGFSGLELVARLFDLMVDLVGELGLLGEKIVNSFLLNKKIYG